MRCLDSSSELLGRNGDSDTAATSRDDAITESDTVNNQP